MKTILIIEDDPSIRIGLKESLELEHYRVLVADDGLAGDAAARREAIDLILLDLTLPGRNGEEVCRGLRHDGINTPIIMLTAKKDEIDRIIGFEVGADDYVTKPFSMRELHARIRAVLRRGMPIVREMEECSFGALHFDFRKQEALRDGAALKLSAMEFNIIKYFAAHEGEVISRDMLLDEVWGYESFPTTRTVDNFILALRKKIETDPARPRHLVTVHRAGYRFIKSPPDTES